MKIATDLEQSKKLAEFLPIESADMYYDVNDYECDSETLRVSLFLDDEEICSGYGYV